MSGRLNYWKVRLDLAHEVEVVAARVDGVSEEVHVCCSDGKVRSYGWDTDVVQESPQWEEVLAMRGKPVDRQEVYADGDGDVELDDEPPANAKEILDYLKGDVEALKAVENLLEEANAVEPPREPEPGVDGDEGPGPDEPADEPSPADADADAPEPIDEPKPDEPPAKPDGPCTCGPPTGQEGPPCPKHETNAWELSAARCVEIKLWGSYELRCSTFDCDKNGLRNECRWCLKIAEFIVGSPQGTLRGLCLACAKRSVLSFNNPLYTGES